MLGEATVLCVLALSQGAAASTTYCQVGDGGSHIIDQQPTACGASMVTINGGLASATASLATGTLKALAASPNVPPGQTSYADSYVSYTETFDILASVAADAIFQVIMHGSFSGGGAGTAGLQVAVGVVNGPSGAVGANLDVLEAQDGTVGYGHNTGFDGALWANPTPGLWETALHLVNGTYTFYIQMVASASASNGGIVDFGNTFGFDIVLPTGATMTSESGVFLTQAPAPVPLPATLPLMAGAVAGLGLWRRLGRSHRIERPA